MKNEERKVEGASTPPTPTHCELDGLDGRLDHSESDDFEQATIGFCPNEGPLPYKVIHEDNIPDMVGRVHSFDIGLAAKYGTNEAILIAHFQFWIGLNRAKEIHIHDGRCWTYQSRKDIQAQFPYWTEKEVRNLCDKLVNLSVLIKGNYSKNPLNRTGWYAFRNEKKFRVDGETSNNLYKCPKGPIAKTILKPIENKQDSNNVSDWPQRANALAPLGTCYKDTDSNLTDKKKELMSDPPASGRLAHLFFNTLQNINPTQKLPNFDKWAKEFDKMMRIDGRTEEGIIAVIKHMVHLHKTTVTGYTWFTWVQSPEKLREKYDKLSVEMNTKSIIKVSSPENDEKLVEKVMRKFSNRKDITVGCNYIEFDNGTNAIPTHLKFGSKDFTPNVLKEVRKRNLPTDGL